MMRPVEHYARRGASLSFTAGLAYGSSMVMAFAFAEALVGVCLAHPVRCVVHIAALKNRETRKRAERESATRLWARGDLADYGGGRGPSLNPCDEGTQRVEIVGPGTAGAVMHPRYHEQARIVLQMLEAATECLCHRRVIVHADERRQRRIAPSVVHDQLAAGAEERREVGVLAVGVESRDDRVEQCDLGGIAKIESQRIIRRIIKDEEPHELVLERELEWGEKKRNRNRSERIFDVKPTRGGP